MVSQLAAAFNNPSFKEGLVILFGTHLDPHPGKQRFMTTEHTNMPAARDWHDGLSLDLGGDRTAVHWPEREIGAIIACRKRVAPGE